MCKAVKHNQHAVPLSTQTWAYISRYRCLGGKSLHLEIFVSRGLKVCPEQFKSDNNRSSLPPSCWIKATKVLFQQLHLQTTPIITVRGSSVATLLPRLPSQFQSIPMIEAAWPNHLTAHALPPIKIVVVLHKMDVWAGVNVAAYKPTIELSRAHTPCPT